MKKVLPESEISRNLVKAIKASAMDEKSFAAAIGLQKQHLMEYISGKRTPSRITPKLVDLGFSSDWYLTGNGEMLVSNVKTKTKEESYHEKLGKAVQELLSEVVQKEKEKYPEHKVAESPEIYKSNTKSIPLYGHAIAAGQPADSTCQVEQYLELPRHMIPHPKQTYAVKAQGNSMILAGIEEGDILIVDRAIEPISKNIVIASINGEQTVKRLLIDGENIKLMPENHNYEPIEIGKDIDFRTQGVVTWVIRKTN